MTVHRAIAILGVGLALAPGCDKTEDAPAPDTPAKATSDKPTGFTKYKLRSMSSEAVVKVRQLADGVRAAYETESIGSIGGEVAARTLPAAAPITPAPGSCCKQPKGQCVPSADQWASEAWKAVMFEINDPHYYSYALEVEGDTFVAKAVGDLDCDGTFSTFSVTGKVVDGELTVGELVKTDELE